MARPCRHVRAAAVDCADAFDASDVEASWDVLDVRMHTCPSCGAAWVVRRLRVPGGQAAEPTAAQPLRLVREERVDLGERAVARVHAAAHTRSLDLLGLRDLDARPQSASSARRGGRGIR